MTSRVGSGETETIHMTTDHAIVIEDVKQDIDEETKEALTYFVYDQLWEAQFVNADPEWIEGENLGASLAARVGDFAADASNDLTSFERSKLEDAAHIIARAETEDEE